MKNTASKSIDTIVVPAQEKGFKGTVYGGKYMVCNSNWTRLNPIQSHSKRTLKSVIELQ